MHFSNLLVRRGGYLPYILTVDPNKYEKEDDNDSTLLKNVNKSVVVFRTGCIQLRELFLGILGSKIRNTVNEPSFHKPSDKTANETCAFSCWRRIKDIVTDEIFSFPDRQVGWLPFVVRRGYNIIRRENIDVVFATGAPWTSLLAGRIISGFTDIPLVLDYRDPWIDNPFHRYKKSFTFRIFSQTIEKWIVDKASSVILNTDSLRNALIKRYGEDGKFQVLPNGYLKSDLRSNSREKSGKNENEFIFIHTGGLYGHRSIDNFLKAFRTCLEQNVFADRVARLFLIGVGPESEKKCRLILGDQMFEKHCFLSARLDHDRCIKHMKVAHCLLLFQQGTTVQVPRKLFEYLALRKPIIAITPQDGDTARIIHQNNAGIVVQDNIASITNVIENIYSNYRQHYDQLQGNDDYKKYEMGALVVTLENILDSILKDGVLNSPEIQH
jgi:glycosyltransferase involved in cell wall biosynthesis